MSVDFLLIFKIPQKCSACSTFIFLPYFLSICIIAGIIPYALLVCCFHTVLIIAVLEHAHHSPQAKEVGLRHIYQEMLESSVKSCSPRALE